MNICEHPQHYAEGCAATIGGWIMLKFLNPWTYIKSAIKKGLKYEVQVYGDELENAVIDWMKSGKTEQEIRSLFDSKQKAIMDRIDLF